MQILITQRALEEAHAACAQSAGVQDCGTVGPINDYSQEAPIYTQQRTPWHKLLPIPQRHTPLMTSKPSVWVTPR